MKSSFAALVLILSSVCVLPATAEGDPAAPVHQLCDGLIDAMKLGDKAGIQGREDKLKPVIASAYDMPAVTKATLGVAANKLSPEDLTKLSDAYAHLSVATYADQFSKYGGERFEVGQPRPGANGTTVVPSFIITGDGNRTAIDYVMHEENGKWGIVDILFNGSISQVAVRRSELVPIYRQNGLQGLIDALDKKTQAMEKK
jgi:phospholipid transport system substrate-binding protein